MSLEVWSGGRLADPRCRTCLPYSTHALGQSLSGPASTCIEDPRARTSSVASRSARSERSYRVRHRRLESWTSSQERRGLCQAPDTTSASRAQKVEDGTSSLFARKHTARKLEGLPFRAAIGDRQAVYWWLLGHELSFQAKSLGSRPRASNRKQESKGSTEGDRPPVGWARWAAPLRDFHDTSERSEKVHDGRRAWRGQDGAANCARKISSERTASRAHADVARRRRKHWVDANLRLRLTSGTTRRRAESPAKAPPQRVAERRC